MSSTNSVSFKFVHVNQLCDRLASGEINEATFNRLCAKYEEHVAFFVNQPSVVENGIKYLNVEAGPGSRKLRVA